MYSPEKWTVLKAEQGKLDVFGIVVSLIIDNTLDSKIKKKIYHMK